MRFVNFVFENLQISHLASGRTHINAYLHCNKLFRNITSQNTCKELKFTIATIWANSAGDTLISFSYFTHKVDFDISCKLSPRETICLKCQSLFSGRYKNNISKCLLNFLPIMLSVKFLGILFFLRSVTRIMKTISGEYIFTFAGYKPQSLR